MNRYDRQIRLEEVGILGQKKLAKASVLCIGAGGLGSAILYYLASAGVGTIAIVDGDYVDLTNLQRQILFTEADQGLAKASVAKARLEKLNSTILVVAINEFLNEQNAENLFKPYDLVIDGTDSFATKFLINKTAKKLNKSWIYGSVTGFEGQLAFFHPQGSCLHCLIPKAPIQNQFSCAEAGVLGAMVGWIASMQALEAIRYFVSDENCSLESKLLFVDGWNYTQRKFEIPQQADCPVCHNLCNRNDLSVKDSAVNNLSVNDSSVNDRNTNNSSVSKLSNNDYSAIIKEKVSANANGLSAINSNQSSHLIELPIEVRESELTRINPTHFLLIDLCDEPTERKFSADYQYSISDLFTQDDIPSEWKNSTKPLLFFCERGYKSQSALSYLHALGFKDAIHLVGGVVSWKKVSATLITRIRS
jgi:adenylyltransferase/sulfurtransferase